MKEIAVFRVNSLWCGLDISAISEITSAGRITPVYGASEHIAGIINLRGQIVTILSLSQRFGFSPNESNTNSSIIILHHDEENIGLLADEIYDILPVKKECLEKKPSHLDGVSTHCFSQVMKTPDMLIMLLDLPRVLTADPIEQNQ